MDMDTDPIKQVNTLFSRVYIYFPFVRLGGMGTESGMRNSRNQRGGYQGIRPTGNQ